MKKTFYFIACILVLYGQTALAQSHPANLANYKQIPDTLRSRDKLIKYVIPDKNYTYWEFDRGEMDTTRSGKVIFSIGKKPEGIVIKDPRGSMFSGCLPAFCYNYIAYVYNGKVGYITNDKDFISFMGKIDNFQEAILLAITSEGLYPDPNKKGGAYLTTPTGFQLLLTKYTLCPQSKQAVQVTISSEGIIKKTARNIFYKTKDCLVI